MIETILLLYTWINQAINLYLILLFIYILMSWVPSTRETKFGKILEKIVEPYLAFFRRFIPPLGMIDFSPIVAILVLNLLIRSGVREVFNLILKFVS
ncbi:YggT family protein [Sporosarcina sp. FSL K6-1522]|uniref:YggT family protein n=1 Tax=Sporosarcina sp. FSL K6-1522 TaxID=2921554 RepID=UPI00315A4070